MYQEREEWTEGSLMVVVVVVMVVKRMMMDGEE